MDAYQRQQFDFFLNTAVERFVERIEQRNEGAEIALERLRQSPNGEGIWISEFVDAVFSDFLLDNADGACFILRALAARTAVVPAGQNVEAMLKSMARGVFTPLLKQKTEEALEQRISYQPVRSGE